MDSDARVIRSSVPLETVECPECGAEIVVTFDTVVKDGNLDVEVNLADVYAHAWLHDSSE